MDNKSSESEGIHLVVEIDMTVEESNVGEILRLLGDGSALKSDAKLVSNFLKSRLRFRITQDGVLLGAYEEPLPSSIKLQ